MDIQIAGKTYKLGRIKATRENLAKLFNASDNSGSIEAQFDFLDLLELAITDGSGSNAATEALDNLSLQDIGKSDSDYGRAYAALLTLAYGKKDLPKEDGKA